MPTWPFIAAAPWVAVFAYVALITYKARQEIAKLDRERERVERVLEDVLNQPRRVRPMVRRRGEYGWQRRYDK